MSLSLQLGLSMLVSLPSLSSLSSLSTITIISSLTPSVLSTAGNFCPVEGSDYFDKPEGNIIKEYFECPGAEDPPEHTVCCGQSCCPLTHIDSVLRVDIKVAMLISLSIILLSVATAVSLVVCCFKHGCPLYDTCSGGYSRADNLPYGSDYDGSDQDLLQGNGNVKASKKFYTTAKDKRVDVSSAEHV